MYTSLPTRALATLVTAAALALVANSAVAVAAKGPNATTCSVPATDLCTDFVVRTERWRQLPLTYYVNTNTAIPPLGFAQDVQDAFDAWEQEAKSPAVEAAYPGDRSQMDFTYAGELTGVPAARDGINTVTFAAPHNGSAGSVAIYARSRALVEFDMQLNAGFTWMTDLTCPTHDCGHHDVQNVVTHEVGHVVGLYHVGQEAHRRLTMYGNSAEGSFINEISKRDLGAGDVLGLRKAYPLP
jgi:hypothetical protein